MGNIPKVDGPLMTGTNDGHELETSDQHDQGQSGDGDDPRHWG
ncbi:MAG: hypothetical protein OEW83_19720 [Acidimicrobiia bacterium]|nr:hypothetical protein [Acidimicrobiia bacterium]